jgi:hypothetical protein
MVRFVDRFYDGVVSLSIPGRNGLPNLTRSGGVLFLDMDLTLPIRASF